MLSTELEAFLQNKLKSHGDDEVNKIIESSLSNIKTVLESSDDSKKINALLSLNVIIKSDFCNKGKLAEFVEPLEKTMNSNDPEILKVCAVSIGKLAISLMSVSTEFFESCIKYSMENLQHIEKYDPKLAAVLVLKELALYLPSLFFQHISSLFKVLFLVFREPKLLMRETAASTLNAALKIIVQRESKTTTMNIFYEQCLEEIEKPYQQEGLRRRVGLDDWCHGNLLIFNQLLCFCDVEFELLFMKEKKILEDENTEESYERDRSILNGKVAKELFKGSADDGEGETMFQESKIIKELINRKMSRLTVNVFKQKSSKHPYIHQCILDILPRIASLFPRLFFFNHLEDTLEYIKSDIKGKDKAQSFISLGLICLAMKENISKHNKFIFAFLHQNIVCKDKKVKNPRIHQSAVLSCIFMLANAMICTNNEINANNSSSLEVKLNSLSIESTPIKHKVNDQEDGKKNDKVLAEFISFIQVILSLPISKSMLVALERLAKVDGILKRYIQLNLLKKLHLILVMKELRHPFFITSLTNGAKSSSSIFDETIQGTNNLTNQLLELSSNKDMDFSDNFVVSEGLGDRKLLQEMSFSSPPSSSFPSPSLFSPQFSPPSSLSSFRNSLPRRVSLLKTQPSQAFPNLDDIALALKTLGDFDFDGFSLSRLVEFCVDEYLNHRRKDIRINTVVAATKLLGNNYLTMSQQPHMDLLVCGILCKILRAAVVDEDADIRYHFISCLKPPFDTCLSHQQCLILLASCVHDTDSEVRELAVCILGRLSLSNPSFVLPFLRKIIVRILTELDYSGQDSNKVDSCHLISHLARCAPNLIATYARPIVDVVLSMLKEHATLSNSVIVALLQVLGAVAQVTGPSFVRMSDIIIPIIIAILQESLQSSHKRRVALQTLSELVSGLCYPMEPYTKYPELLDVIMSFFKSDTPLYIKKEAVRVLGTLGALDPFKLKGISNQPLEDPGITISKTAVDPKNAEINSNELLVTMSSTCLDEFYPAVALSTLIKMLKDPALVTHHTAVILAISSIFTSLGHKGLDFLAKVFPLYCELIKNSNDLEFKKLLLTNMGVIVKVMKQYIKTYLPDIFILIHSLWQTNASLTTPIIQLLDAIVASTDCELRKYLPHFISLFMKTFKEEEDKTYKPDSIALMVAMQEFGTDLDDYIHFLLPPVINVINQPTNHISARRTALETILVLIEKVDLSGFTSRIFFTVKKVLTESSELNDVCCQVVLKLSSQLQAQSPTMSSLVSSYFNDRVSYVELMAAASKLGEKAKKEAEEEEKEGKKDCGSATEAFKLKVDSALLQKTWKANKKAAGDEWLDWLRRLTRELIRQSPSPCLRAMHLLASEYSPLAKELFNAAFVSCWMELTNLEQQDFSKSLRVALEQSDSLEVTQCMLNLSEFVEHCENCSLPLDLPQLSDKAMNCRAYAKALHFKEVEFRNGATNEILESLLSINNKLQQPEAAQGVLEYVKKQNRSDMKIQERWYEKLHDWSRALASYERQQEKAKGNVELMLGRMRCLEALGEWSKIHEIAQDSWFMQKAEIQESMARVCATAALRLGDWISLPEYVRLIPENTYDSSFYKGVIHIYNDDYNLAKKAIEHARHLLINEMTTLSGEGYGRAYEVMVNMQTLIELEEVIEYKIVLGKREAIKELWWARLKGCQHILEDWQRFLQIRTLVIDPKEDVRPWLKYASLCSKNNMHALAGRTLTLLLGRDPKRMSDDELLVQDRNVVYAYLKHSWSDVKKRKSTFERLKMFLEHITPPTFDYVLPSRDPFLSKCYHRLATWFTTINTGSNLESVSYLNEAINYNGESIKAWHSFAYANYEVVLALKQLKSDGADEETIQKISTKPQVEHCKASLKGFIHSIINARSPSQTLQDTLRLLTLWFEYGDIVDVSQIVSDGLDSVVVENWIQVIPQLIARIDIKKPLIENIIKKLLIQIARRHPQALIYPLTVALKSGVKSRTDAALVVINSMREMYNNTVQQASVVSDELIRVAILWHELWHEGLEEASRLYFGNKNIPGMLLTLEPLHKMVHLGPKTMKENSFVQAYGADLATAYDFCCRYKQTRNLKELTQAWDVYYQIFRRITKQLPQLTSLQLKYISPKLLECENLEVTVPGTYLPNQPQINVSKVYNEVSVITSKQRPRKITMRGSDGNDYQFLLKGHEDLRQDERVMQLFGLVNSVLLSNPTNPRRNLSIQRYSVIPLSTNIGLIGWVPNCDTLHSLIRDYRDKKKILLNIEHRIMLRVFQDYERLMLMQKVEVFEHALESTKGDDLAQILWNKSASSEVWFDRRTNYTRSLAVMSVVGYILGLGDRHPSNLMLDRLTGKIMHIDFGDCFEVAMHREKFPEKIPFRLTRMLINAMEVTGIDGNYKITCENVMKILREHKDSLMAVLEAFIYDPLLNWKLLDVTAKKSAGMEGGYALTQSQDSSNLSTSFANTKNPAETGNGNKTQGAPPEEINKKGLLVLNRVKHKLTGRDFENEEPVDVSTQISMLIDQATRHEHLCQCYIGWCPFW